MKIIGETWIETETVLSEKVTKNKVTTRLLKVKHRALLLECGHARSYQSYMGSKIPASNTECFECDVEPRRKAKRARLEARAGAVRPQQD